MKKLVFLFIASLLLISMAWGQGSEDFENHSLSGTTYVNGSFVGNNSITWTYVQVTGEQSYPITNKGILLRRSDTPSSITSSTISGGIGSFSVQMRKAFTSTGDRQVALYVNNNWIANSQTFGALSGEDATIHTFSVSNINITGDVVIQIRHITGNTSNRQLVLDNLTWTAYSGGSPTPAITVAPSALSGFGYAVDYGPSAYKTFSVSGSDLKANIGLTAPTNYEISQSSGSGYTGSISLTPTSGSVAETTIYVRLKSGLSTGSYNGENITAASTDATSRIVTCSGSVITPAATSLPYSEPFTSDLSGVYTYTVSGSKPWLYSSGVASCNGFSGTGNEQHWMILPGINFNSYSNERMSFTTEAYYGTIDANNYLKLYYSTNYSGYGDPNAAGVTWTEISYTNGGVGGGVTSSGILDLSDISGSSVFIGFKYLGTNSPTRWYVDDISIYQATPTITVIDNLNYFTYVHNAGPSAEQSFSVSGADLTANISITAPTNYEISVGTGGSFSATSPITLTRSGSTVNETTIYVRLKAGLAVGSYNSENISLGSFGADQKTVTCNGSVTTPAAPGAPTATAASNLSYNGFTANWNTVSGATGYYLDVYTKTTGSNATDLIISEYVEGSGTGNKYIEIFNGTGSSVDLSNYTLRLYSNGSPTVSQSVALVGTLLNGNTYVIGRTDGAIYTSSNLTSNTVINFNGDDAIELYRTDTLATVDIFGRIGDDPGTQWTGDGGYTTLDKTLVRKSSVSQGITVNPTGTGPTAFTTLTTEWDMYNQDTATFLGSHTFSGGSSKTFVSGYENRNVSNVLTYEVTGLNPETTYYYVVRAYDVYSQTSGSSNERSVTTDGFDYPADEDVIVGDNTVTVTGGNANNGTGTLPAWPNGDVTEGTYDSLILDLLGAGPWTVTILSDAYYCAYSQGAGWNLATPVSGGFEIEVDAPVKGEPLYILLSNEDPTLPVELSSFTVAMNAYNAAVLTWVTQTETGVNGFYIYRGTTDQLSEAALVSNLIPATNTSQTQVYRYSDSELFSEGTYYYWLNVNDMDGSESFHGPVTLVYETGENPTPSIPQVTELKSIYPNPFNPSANISFGLAKSSDVEFKIYNSRGQMVRNMALGVKDAGTWNLVWNGTDNNGRAVPTGIYYIQMQAGKDSFIRKAVMMK